MHFTSCHYGMNLRTECIVVILVYMYHCFTYCRPYKYLGLIRIYKYHYSLIVDRLSRSIEKGRIHTSITRIFRRDIYSHKIIAMHDIIRIPKIIPIVVEIIFDIFYRLSTDASTNSSKFGISVNDSRCHYLLVLKY